MIRKLCALLAVLGCLFLPAGSSLADGCPNGLFNPVTDVCWGCTMPI